MTLKEKFFQPIDNSQLVLFRILYGFFITAEAWGAIMTGWVRRVLVEPQMNFPFLDFDFLHPLPGNGMYFYFFLMGCFGWMVTLGYRYRIGIIGYTIMWAGVYFMQKTSYNNHYYLMVLFNFIFCFMPANRYASFDAKQQRVETKNYCPQWCVWWFKAMILTVYFYSAVAKMYPGWLTAEPIKIWFSAKAHFPIIGKLLIQEWFQYFVAWGGITFDLLVGPALLWKKTRKYAFITSLFFHAFNSAVFHVGVFPYLGISFSVLFFEAKTIRKLFFRRKKPFDQDEARVTWNKSPIVLGLISAFLLIQILLPLRHWYFKGDVNWTEEGHRLAWHMMLRIKAGSIFIYIEDEETNIRQSVDLSQYLTPKQTRAIATRPDMMWYFVQHLKQDYYAKGRTNFGIYAVSYVSLNGAESRPLYDPEYNLVNAEWNKFSENDWVLR